MQRAALLFAVMAAGCAHVSVDHTVLNSSYQANPIATDDVFVYEEGDSIPEHTQVAFLNASGGRSDGITNWASDNDLRDALREKAGRLGANAIIWGDVDSPGFFSLSTTVRSSAVAIYVPSLGRGANDNR